MRVSLVAFSDDDVPFTVGTPVQRIPCAREDHRDQDAAHWPSLEASACLEAQRCMRSFFESIYEGGAQESKGNQNGTLS